MAARSDSATLQAKSVGLELKRNNSRAISFSSGDSSSVIAGFPLSKCGRSLSMTATSAFAVFDPARTSFCKRSCRFWSDARSARTSSVLITSMSRIGSIVPLTWWMSAFSKQRTTCTIAFTSRMWLRNWLPSPSPALAPLTRPAMSTNSIAAGMIFCECESFESASRRASGTVTMPRLGSIVQKG